MAVDNEAIHKLLRAARMLGKQQLNILAKLHKGRGGARRRRSAAGAAGVGSGARGGARGGGRGPEEVRHANATRAAQRTERRGGRSTESRVGDGGDASASQVNMFDGNQQHNGGGGGAGAGGGAGMGAGTLYAAKR